jgi:2,5-dioxopentanoate dehydrogenase
MTVSGKFFIGAERVGASRTFRAINPATGDSLEPDFAAAGEDAVERACALAWSAFDSFRELDSELRARFLEAIAEQILALGDALLERGHLESGLPIARLTGERARTVGQLRLFADELRKGGWLGIRVDPALPDRKPAPRSDLRQRQVPLGPVVVFGASARRGLSGDRQRSFGTPGHQ